jgi:hypothetical protein
MAKARAKEEFKKKMSETEPVFRFKVERLGVVKCKQIGYVENKDKLCDETIELETPTGGVEIDGHGKYEIIGRACICNVPGSYLLKNKKYPLYYVNLLYATQLVSGYLFNYFVYFQVDEETSKKLLLPRNYIGRELRGIMTLELVADDGFVTFAIKKKRPQIEKEIMEKYMEEFDNMSNEDKCNLEVKINLEVEQKLDFYRNYFEPVTLTEESNGYYSRKKLLNKIVDIYKSENFQELIDLCLQFREHERRDKMGSDKPFKLPKKVINLKEFKDDPNKIDDYINNLSSDSSDSEEDNSDSNDN